MFAHHDSYHLGFQWHDDKLCMPVCIHMSTNMTPYIYIYTYIYICVHTRIKSTTLHKANNTHIATLATEGSTNHQCNHTLAHSPYSYCSFSVRHHPYRHDCFHRADHSKNNSSYQQLSDASITIAYTLIRP